MASSRIPYDHSRCPSGAAIVPVPARINVVIVSAPTKIQEGCVCTRGYCVIPYGVTCGACRQLTCSVLVRNVLVGKHAVMADKNEHKHKLQMSLNKTLNETVVINIYGNCRRFYVIVNCKK